MVMEQKYELTTKGANSALLDYLRKNWKELTFRGDNADKICGMNFTFAAIQTEFTKKDVYRFVGDAMIQIDNCIDGGYNEDSFSISGYVGISVNSDGLYVEKIEGFISIHRKIRLSN